MELSSDFSMTSYPGVLSFFGDPKLCSTHLLASTYKTYLIADGFEFLVMNNHSGSTQQAIKASSFQADQLKDSHRLQSIGCHTLGFYLTEFANGRFQ